MQYLGIDWGTQGGVVRGRRARRAARRRDPGRPGRSVAPCAHARAGGPRLHRDDERRGLGARALAGVRLGSRSPTRGRSRRSRRWRARPTRRRAGARRPRSPRPDPRGVGAVARATASSVSGCDVARTWSGCRRPRSTARSGCSPSGACVATSTPAPARRPGTLAERGVPAVWPLAAWCCWTSSMTSNVSSQRSMPSWVLRAPRSARETAGHDSRRRRAARTDDRLRDRRHRPLPQRSQASRLRRTDTDDQAIRPELPDRPDLQGRPRHAALGRRRSRPARLAADQPLARALHRHQAPPRQGQPGQGGRRAQDPDRRWHVLARHSRSSPTQRSLPILFRQAPRRLAA